MTAVKAGDIARLDAETFAAERQRITQVCQKCQSANFTAENIANGDQMLKEADKLFAEAISIVAGLRRDGLIPVGEGQGVYLQLLSFYEVETHVEQILYEMFMDHRMKTFQGAFHINPDYTTWYGHAKMKKDLTEIREIDRELRAQHSGPADAEESQVALDDPRRATGRLQPPLWAAVSRSWRPPLPSPSTLRPGLSS